MGSRYGKLARLLCAAALVAVGEAASGQEADETPLALVLSANGAVNGASSGPHLLRTGAALPLSARPGEILLAGDALRSEGGSIIFLSCTANSQRTPSPDGDGLVELRGMKLRQAVSGVRNRQPAVFLPPMPRSIIASRQHAGAAWLASYLPPAQSFQQRLGQIREAQRSQLHVALAPIDAAIQANPNDPMNHLARAALLERFGMARDAADRCAA
jgi:hypothetical protein